MLQSLMITLLCGMATYLTISYIFIIGLSRGRTKFLPVKCVIIGIGALAIFIAFKEVTPPLTEELYGRLSIRSESIGYTKELIVMLAGSCVGYIGQLIKAKE